MKAILAACLLAACAFAFAIGIAQADSGGGAAAAPSQSTPATQPVQQEQQQDQPGAAVFLDSVHDSMCLIRFCDLGSGTLVEGSLDSSVAQQYPPIG